MCWKLAFTAMTWACIDIYIYFLSIQNVRPHRKLMKRFDFGKKSECDIFQPKIELNAIRFDLWPHRYAVFEFYCVIDTATMINPKLTMTPTNIDSQWGICFASVWQAHNTHKPKHSSTTHSTAIDKYQYYILNEFATAIIVLTNWTTIYYLVFYGV